MQTRTIDLLIITITLNAKNCIWFREVCQRDLTLNPSPASKNTTQEREATLDAFSQGRIGYFAGWCRRSLG
jgi:hypothetical protein